MRRVSIVLACLSFILVPLLAHASHSWGGYHWARTANPFTLKLGDNVSSAWDSYLGTTSTDWSASPVLDTSIVAGQGGKKCRASAGRVEVCNDRYGRNGWLGIAQIWINGSHITQGLAKMNDSYFNSAPYNTFAWKNLVMCQEVAHTFGLDHQDETFNNTNLGTCMDYTNDPDGTIYNQLSNEQPNVHDFAELGIIYAHLDSSTTLSAGVPGSNGQDVEDAKDWGKVVKKDAKGKPSLYEKDLGKGDKIYTHVLWAE